MDKWNRSSCKIKEFNNNIKKNIFIKAYGNNYGEVIFRDLPNLKEKKRAAVSVSGPVLSLMLSKDKRFLLFGCSDGELTVMTDPNINKSPGLAHPLLSTNITEK